MELREMGFTAGVEEETVGLLLPTSSTSTATADKDRDRENENSNDGAARNETESYFIEYAIQKEMINRNRCPASRRLLLSQAAYLADFNLANNSNQHQHQQQQQQQQHQYQQQQQQQQQQQKDIPLISIIHPSGPNWPPSRRREEARALENLRKRVEQSKLFKANQVSDPGGSAPSTSNHTATANAEELQLDNRPKLLKKILSNKPMSIAHDSTDLETDWRDSEFITECLCWHNVYRQRHNSPPLTMSPQLCEYAQTWANHLAHTNTFYYRNDKEIGQNLYCRPGSGVPGDITGQDVSSYWYSAVKQYDFLKEPDILHANVNAGHFTQLIWASSRNFGVGKARSRSGKVIVVANYQPVGNMSGQFQRNVLPPLPESANLPVPAPPRIRAISESPNHHHHHHHSIMLEDDDGNVGDGDALSISGSSASSSDTSISTQ